MSHPQGDLGSNLAKLKLTPFDPSKYSSRVNSVTSSSTTATNPEPAYSVNEHWEGSMTSGVTNYEAPSSGHSPAGSSAVTETPEVANYETVSSTSRLHDNDLNPRAAPSTTNRAVKAEPVATPRRQATFPGRSLQTSVPATAKTNSSMYTKVNTLAQTTTHGRTAISASCEAPFPCTYADCTRGFQTRPDLKEHKIQEHDYCRVCDIDFEDDDAFNAHKVASNNHICCAQCFVDFRSEEGRDRHFKQMHMMQNNVKCRGCGETFAKGSGLLAHFEWGRCKGRGKNEAERDFTRIKPEDLNRNRALTALEMERVTQQKKEGGETGILNTLPAPRLGESVDVGSVAGGVPIDIADQPDYLVNTFQETRDISIAKFPNLLPIEHKGDTSPPESMLSSNFSLSKDHFPALNSKNLGKLNTTPGANKTAAWVNEGNISAKAPMSNTIIPPTGYPKVGQSLEDYAKEVGDKTMSQKLFPNAPPTPATPRVPSGGGPSIVPSQSGFSIGTRMRGFDWEPDPLDGKWHCPFKPQGCKKKFESGEKLEDHLMSGEHRGFVTNCPGCLRRFKTPSALAAHLESATTRCSIRESDQYGNTLAQVSGGFLGVEGMHSDGTPFIKDAEKNDVRGVKW